VRFPFDGAVHVALPGDLPTGPVELRLSIDGGPARTVAGRIGGGRLSIERLPPEADVTVSVPTGPGWSLSPVTFRTPGRTTLENLVCLPSDVEVLVDGDNPGGQALEAEITPWGSRTVTARTGTPADQKVFRHVFVGLRPATEYALTVRFVGGWGGVMPYRFETLAADRTSYVLDQLHLLTTNPELADMPAETFRLAPDRRSVKPVVTTLERRWDQMPWSARMTLAQSLARLRAPDVWFAFSPALQTGAHDRPHLAYLAAVAASRDRRALDAARTMLEQGPKDDKLTRIAAVLGALPGRPTFELIRDQIAPRISTGHTATVARAMVRVDREAASDHFSRVLSGSTTATPLDIDLAIAAVPLLRDERPIEGLSRFLEPRLAGRHLAQASLAMASTDTPAARRALSEAFDRNPAQLPLVLFLGLARPDGVGAHLAPLLETGRPRSLRSAAALAVGLAGARRAVTRRPHQVAPPWLGPIDDRAVRLLIEALGDPDPGVRDTACLALGHIPDRTAVAALRRFSVGETDLRGRGAMALAEQGDSGAAGPLLELLDRLAPRTDPGTFYRRAVIGLALGRLRHAPARPAIESLARRSGKDRPAVGFCAREALRELSSAPSEGLRTIWVDPASPVVRTGVRLEAGGSIEIRASGLFGWGGGESAVHQALEPCRPSPDGPDLRLVAWFSGREIDLTAAWQRFHAEQSGELLVLTIDQPYRDAPGGRPDHLPSGAVGIARVDMRR
jgi:HEAT repeat protein